MYLSLSLTILGLVGNCDVPQVCVSTRFLPSAVSLENLQTSFPKNGCNTGAASYSHGAVQCGDYFLIISQNAYYRIIITGKKGSRHSAWAKNWN